jgi:protein tyrosine/serine phosphatase
LSAASDRALRWEALLNARDLGGLPAAAGVVALGAVIRSDALYRLNDAGRTALREYGVRTVIDMRTPNELEMNPYQLEGVRVAHIAQQTEDMWESTRRLGLGRVATDTTMLQLACSRFARIAETIADAPEGGVLFHCHVGKDRTGLMTMVLLDLVGTPPDVIAADYALTATGLAELFTDLIAKAESEARRVRLTEEAMSRPEVMYEIHKVLRERYGGADAYLRAGGMSDASIATLRARLLGASRRT